MKIVAEKGVAFPEISEILVWKHFFGDGTWYEFNKISVIVLFAALMTFILFQFGGKGAAVPRGLQNLVESAIEFIRNQIIVPTMGADGFGYTRFLSAFFFFIFFCNIGGLIPTVQMPATARMAVPLVLTLIIYFFFIGVGIKHQGFGHYFKGVLVPPGVPKPIYLLVTPIELLSTFFIRPVSLAVRLFANMLAGHILLVTFAVLSQALWGGWWSGNQWQLPLAILPFAMLVLMTAFEVLVAFLQAYIFTILAAVYIGGALHPEH
jgi:F-type H+-transporting ATPase subunit a